MNHFEPKPITPEYLREKSFTSDEQGLFEISISDGIYRPVIINVFCHENILVVSMAINGADKWSVLPIETEQQLNKLINALQGK